MADSLDDYIVLQFPKTGGNIPTVRGAKQALKDYEGFFSINMEKKTWTCDMPSQRKRMTKPIGTSRDIDAHSDWGVIAVYRLREGSLSSLL